MFLSGIGLIAWLGLFVAISTAVVGVVAAALMKTRYHAIWGGFCFAVCVWSGSFFLIGQANDAATALFWWRISHVGVAFIPASFLHFSFEYIGFRRWWVASTLYTVAAAFAYLSVATDLIVAGARWSFGEFYYDLPGPLYGLLITTFAFCCMTALILLHRASRQTKDPDHRRNLSLLVPTCAVGFGGGFLSFAPVYGIDLYPIGIAAVAIAPPIIAYTILRHQLLEFQVSLEQFFQISLATVALANLMLSNSPAAPIVNGSLVVAAFLAALILARATDRHSDQCADMI
jgi:hypothetical protein